MKEEDIRVEEEEKSSCCGAEIIEVLPSACCYKCGKSITPSSPKPTLSDDTTKAKEEVKIERKWAMPSFATFTIKPIAELLERYNIGKGWIDPFAGWNSLAEFTNDINPKAPTTHHTEAEKFVKSFGEGKYQALFDPPYSNRQISEHYKESGLQPNWRDTSAEFYSRVKDPLSSIIKKGGYVISFGWNSSGMGKNRGFEIVEILLVAHGGAHNDTIVTVEKKL